MPATAHVLCTYRLWLWHQGVSCLRAYATVSRTSLNLSALMSAEMEKAAQSDSAHIHFPFTATPVAHCGLLKLLARPGAARAGRRGVLLVLPSVHHPTRRTALAAAKALHPTEPTRLYRRKVQYETLSQVQLALSSAPTTTLQSQRMESISASATGHGSMPAPGVLHAHAGQSTGWLSVPRFYEGRSVFVTGGTGFVGKAVVEKLLRGCPGIRRIFLLIRPKKGSSPAARLEDDIFKSRIWEPLVRERGPGTLDWVRSKLVAVAGDVLEPRLGVSQADLAAMAEEVSVTLHCAASISFDDRLDRAIALNMGGALQALQVSKALPLLAAHLHVSTCYVNSHRIGQRIPEELPPLEVEPRAMLEASQTWTDMEITQKQVEVLSTFPNTYTATKAMAEHLIVQEAGPDFPLIICRPSIVVAAWREPTPGWVDVVSAMGALVVAHALGVVKVVQGSPQNTADLVPLDHCVNEMLVAAAAYARPPLPSGGHGAARLGPSHPSAPVPIVHCGTSDSSNPVKWRVARSKIVEYFDANPLSAKFLPSALLVTPSRQMRDVLWFLYHTLPASAAALYANTFGGAAAKKTASQLAEVNWRAQQAVQLFEHFTMHEFFFLSPSAHQLRAALAPEEVSMWTFDAAEIDWNRYFSHFGHGLSTFVMREDMVELGQEAVAHTELALTSGRLLQWDPDHHAISFPSLIPDLVWAYTSSRRPGYTHSGVLGRLLGATGWREGQAHEAKHVPRAFLPDADALRAAVLASPRVQAALQDLSKGVANAAAGGPESVVLSSDALAEAKRILAHIAATPDPSTPRLLGWGLRKVMRTIYQGITVDEAGLEAVRKLAVQSAQGGGPLLLLPSHRSYMDFLLLSYVFFAYNLPLPFIAAGEDFLGLASVSEMLRRSGAFFIRRSFRDDALYSAILRAYMQTLLVHNQVVEFFIEGTRSRSGKMLLPRYGMLDMALEPLLDGRLSKAWIVPISLDYERPLETLLYSSELLGQRKPKETLGNLLKSAQVLSQSFGRIALTFGAPISAHSLLPQLARDLDMPRITCVGEPAPGPTDCNVAYRESAARAPLMRAVANRLVGAIHGSTAAMPTHLVATLCLQYRQGIGMASLVKQVEWLRRQVVARGGRVACTEGQQRRQLPKVALDLLSPLVTDAEGRQVFAPNVSRREDYGRWITLGYYRNKLLQWWSLEGIWAIAMFAATAVAEGRQLQAAADGLDSDSDAGQHCVAWSAVLPSVLFLDALLRRELVRERSMVSVADTHPFSCLAPLRQRQATVQAVADTAAPCTVSDAVGGLLDALEQGTFQLACAESDGPRPTLDTAKTSTTAVSAAWSALMGSGGAAATPGAAPSEAAGAPSVPSSLPQAVQGRAEAAGLHPAAKVCVARGPAFSLACSMLWPFLDSYWVTVLALAALPMAPAGLADTSAAGSVGGIPLTCFTPRADLAGRTQWLAETLFHQRIISYYEACALETLNNAMATLVDWGVLVTAQAKPSEVSASVGQGTVAPGQRRFREKSVPCVALAPRYASRKALSALASTIAQFRKAAPVPLRSDPFSLTVSAELPMMARL